MREIRCPHMVSKGEGADFCELTDMKPCKLLSGGKCEEWEEIQEEWVKEKEHGNKQEEVEWETGASEFDMRE